MKIYFFTLFMFSVVSINAQNLIVEGFARISSSSSSTLDLRGNNPIVELRDNVTNNYLAFLQVFGTDLYFANRQDGRMIFRTNNLDRMTIASDGNVGIGLTNPASKLTIDGPENNGSVAGLEINSGAQKLIMDGNEIDCTSGGLHLNYNSNHDVFLRTNTRRAEINFQHGDGNGANNGLSIEHPGANNVFWTLYSTNWDGALELYHKGTIKGEFNAESGAYVQFSDRRLKQDIRPMSGVLDRVSQLRPSRYVGINDIHQKPQIGFIAQEVEPLFPELVHRGKIGDTDEEIYQLNYSGFAVVAVAAIQELVEQKSKLSEENQQMKAQIESMEQRLTLLEKRLK